ncbi:MAG: hypothetical protein ABGW87_07670 [Sphingomonadaceae bacterium]
MGIFDAILSEAGASDITNLAAKVGIEPQLAEQAVAALGAAHPQPGDTVATAAAQTGLSASTLSQIVEHIGGEGSLGQYAQVVQDHPQILAGLTSALDRDGDGNPLNDVLSMAKGLFGKS